MRVGEKTDISVTELLERFTGNMLNLSGMAIKDADIRALINYLLQFKPNITKVIDLSNNTITDTGAQLLLTFFIENDFNQFPDIKLAGNTVSVIIQRKFQREHALSKLSEDASSDQLLAYERPFEEEEWSKVNQAATYPEDPPDIGEDEKPKKTIDLQSYLNQLNSDTTAAMLRLPVAKEIQASYYDERKLGSDNPYSSIRLTEKLFVRIQDVIAAARAIARNTILKTLIFDNRPDGKVPNSLNSYKKLPNMTESFDEIMELLARGLQQTLSPLEILGLPSRMEEVTFLLSDALRTFFTGNVTLRDVRILLSGDAPSVCEEQLEWKKDNNGDIAITGDYLLRIYRAECDNCAINPPQGARQWLNEYGLVEYLPDTLIQSIPVQEPSDEAVTAEDLEEMNNTLKEKLDPERWDELTSATDQPAEFICVILTRNAIMQSHASHLLQLSQTMLNQQQSPQAILQHLKAKNLPTSLVFTPFDDDQLKRIIRVASNPNTTTCHAAEFLQYVITEQWTGESQALEIKPEMLSFTKLSASSSTLFSQTATQPEPSSDDESKQKDTKRQRT